jgi:hypothetical protein
MIVFGFWFKVVGSRFKVKKQILSLSQPGTLPAPLNFCYERPIDLEVREGIGSLIYSIGANII